MARHIEVVITVIELVQADVSHPRELVQAKFLEKGFMVTNYENLKYFFSQDPFSKKYYFKVEGNIGEAILKR